VENYTRVITRADETGLNVGALAPLRGHQEANEGDSEANQNVPLVQSGNRKCAAADVEDDDPRQAQQHEAKHDGLEPHRIGCFRSRLLGCANFGGLGLSHNDQV
jgi:hypothetical protein